MVKHTDVAPDELISAEEARRIIGVRTRSGMYHRIRQGKFPKPINAGGRTTVFVKAECHEYVRKLIAERDQLAAERAERRK